MDYDAVLAHIGKIGSYQKRNYLLLCLSIILCAFHKLSGVFLLATPVHRCRLPGEKLNATYALPEDVQIESFPFDEIAGKFSSCEFFSDNFFAHNETSHRTVQCSDFVWDKSRYQSSAVKTFDLVCDRSDLKPLSDALLIIGVFIGSFAFGFLSKKYGRRKVFVTSLLFQLIFGPLIAFSPNFLCFALFRLVI